MSNYLAIAQATEALRGLLARSVQSDVPYAVQVEARKPPSEPVTEPTITVFCYRITPNASRRNADTPTRDGAGRLLRTPTAAYDVHYLISCYGNETQLVPQALLGSVARTLHEQPALSAQDLEAAAGQAFLAGADLAASPQAVRLTPSKMDLEDLSKLWSMLIQTPYTPSIAFDASLLLLESRQVPAAGRPVREHRVRVVPGRRPVVEELRGRPAGSDAEPRPGPVPVGHEVVLTGHDLNGEKVTVDVAGEPVDPSAVDDGQVVFTPPAGLAPGVHPVRVLHEIALGDSVRILDSNEIAMARQATVTASEVTDGRVVATLDLAVGDRQRVSVLLDELDGSGSYRFDAAYPLPGPRDPKAVAVATPGVAAGSYLLRLRIDGVDTVVGEDLRTPVVEF
ncbi:Pvc16 family protein [Streptomyces sp. T028]|uniref:Pvc16 family protein n=1 Tax=Streptomyces sp. T028 TaxID=3394379 RepID=UPI003A8C1567